MPTRLFVEEGASECQTLELQPEKTISVGRNRANTIMVNDPRVSRLHAEIYFADGRWHVSNRSKTNATRVDGLRIRQSARLKNGQVIGVGPARIRFESTCPEDEQPSSDHPVVVSPIDSVCEQLEPDEIAALFYFINSALAEMTPHGLVTRALQTVREQTEATICGFLSFDAEDSQLKVVIPTEAEISGDLSQQLTRKVRERGNTICMKSQNSDDDLIISQSLAAYDDAICVPLRRQTPADAGGGSPGENELGPLGALHAYHAFRAFSANEVRFCEVMASCLANALQVLRARRALEADNSRLRDHSGRGGDELIGTSQQIRQLRGDVAALAVGPCTVLIEGESGVGKELVALALHRLSPRRDGPLIAVNCAGLAGNLAEAELFGHSKGAFTSADKARLGLFQQADEGTLFLDEIGELTPETQARLLRVLETKKVRPVGTNMEIKIDVRIIAATNRDLERETKGGRFRRDLFFRLGTRVHIPPLRDHSDDIPALAEHFLSCLNHEYRRHVRLLPETIERLESYSWPGNVRQLRSVLESAIAMATSDIIRPSDLQLPFAAEESDVILGSLNLEEIEARAIREALHRTGGVLIQAARLLGIHRETLINKMKKYGIRGRSEAPEEFA
jgi:DNA-binding NtrC family response regulator/pSer/pThr/pTyr-binding forkhead associated (FHA) protein